MRKINGKMNNRCREDCFRISPLTCSHLHDRAHCPVALLFLYRQYPSATNVGVPQKDQDSLYCCTKKILDIQKNPRIPTRDCPSIKEFRAI